MKQKVGQGFNLAGNVEIPDSDQRQRAVTETGRNVVLVAGAGTGKTTILVKRIAETVLGQGIPLTQVVALTFTEKAAAEMKIRLGQKLAQMHGSLSAERGGKEEGETGDLCGRHGLAPDDLRARIEAAREVLEQAQIGTIHSFCAHLLRLYPLEARVSPGFQVDEGAVFEEFLNRKWGEWIESELKLGNPREPEWREILGLIRLEDLGRVARALSDFEIPLPAPDWELGEEARLAVRLEEFSLRLQDLVTRLKQVKSVILLEKLERIGEIVRMIRERDPGKDQAVSEFISSGGAPKPSTKWSEEDRELATRLYDEGMELVQVNPRAAGMVFRLLLPFIRSFREEYLAEGWVNFSGLLSLARDLLFRHPEVRRELKQKFRAILVDEFQDTDPIQYQIILLLAEKVEGKASSWDGLELEPGKLFIVGDPKQAIYTFRRADIEAYEEVLERVLRRTGVHLDLFTNFRSHPGIIDFVNRVFDGGARPGLGLIEARAGVQPSYHAIQSSRKQEFPCQKLEMILVDNPGGGLSADEARRGEAELMVRWIRETVGETIPDPEKGSRKSGYSDIALLLRSFTPVSIYLEAFKEAGIPYVIQGEKTFFSAQEVLDFHNLLKAVADPQDQLALVGVLRSPLGGLNDREIYELKARSGLSYLDPSPSCPPGLAPLFRSLRELNALSRQLSLPEIIDEVFARTYIREVTVSGHLGEQKLANLEKIRSRAAEMALPGGRPFGPGLSDFVRILEKSRRELKEEGESPLADETVEAVRVISIHKAKGLEFPFVILADLHRLERGVEEDQPVRADRRGQSLGLSLPGVKSLSAIELIQKEGQRKEEEEKRVLYVALTRARERLLLTGSARYEENTWLRQIARALETDFQEQKTGRLDPGGGVRIDFSIYEFNPARAPRRRAAARAGKPRDFCRISEFWKGREEFYRNVSPRFLSPTGLNKEEEVIAPALTGEDGGRKSRRPGPAGDGPSSARIGIICHRVLERCDFPVLADPGFDLSEAVDRAARDLSPETERPDPETRDEARSLLEGFIRSDIFSGIRAEKILGKEIPFTIPWEGKVMEGIIDLVYEREGETIVADYKTDSVAEGEIPERAEKYRLQREVYLEAVRRGLGIENPRFQLIFLRPAKGIYL
ncbi:MAG: UvrD-helicase domain-containing protein [bacterium]|nr:UvrD-helicase domain-containing protein [bacterium]